MNTQSLMPVRGVYFAQAVMLLAWLYVTEYVILLPFPLTAAVAVGIVAVGGVVTSRRATRALTVLTEVYRLERNRDFIEFHRVISMMPPLYRAFRVLHPQKANNPYGLCHFATWLNASLRSPDTNIIEWAMSYGECVGRDRPALRGLDQHIHEDKRGGMATDVMLAVLAGHADIVLMQEEMHAQREQTQNEHEGGAVKVAV